MGHVFDYFILVINSGCVFLFPILPFLHRIIILYRRLLHHISFSVWVWLGSAGFVLITLLRSQT